MITWEQAVTANEFHAGTCRKLLPPHQIRWIGHKCVRTGPTVETEHGWSIPTQSKGATVGIGYGTIDEDHADWHHTAEDCKPHIILPSGVELDGNGDRVANPLLKGKIVMARGIRDAP
jgi:hypothetical protein